MYLTRTKFGLNIIPPSAKFAQCQSTIRNALKSSINQSITHLWKSTTTTPTCNMINITQQRKLLSHFVKTTKTNLTPNCCIKDHSSQVFPNFRYLKPIRSGQLANLNYRGTFSTSQFDILIILYQPEKTWLNDFNIIRMLLLPSS